MLNLLKYELLRRRRMLIGAALIILFVEGVVLYGIWRGGNWNILSGFLTIALIIGGLLTPILDAVAHYYSDFKQKHGYMLFMTPMNGYRVIGSKGIFSSLELIAIIVLVGGCVTASGFYADSMNNGLISGIIDSIRQQWIAQTGQSESMTPLIITMAITGVLQLITEISIAMLALTVSRSLLPGKSFNWLIALVIYFALALGVNTVNGILLGTLGFIGDIRALEISMAGFRSVMMKYMIAGGVIYILWTAGAMILSGRLLNRGVDL